MGRLEVSCRRFAILSGIEQDPGNYAVCVHPGAPGLQRKGTLALITEAAGSHPSLAVEACKLTQRVVIESYFADSALSLTSSLLNALDLANTALLRFNYASQEGPPGSGGDGAVQSGGVKPGRAKVGVTTLLIRPDGAGVYLSQMAPTQAYVYHNGMLSAIPEPITWRQAPQHSVAVLTGAQGAAGLEGDGDDLDDLPETNFPAPSLGSGPGIEADLVYRRIEAGDMVVLVSTSLARHLDRSRAEQIFGRYDVDGVINALHSIAVDNALAEAHACVLELGVLDSSGVDEDYDAPAKAAQSHVADNGGSVAAPQGPQRAVMPLKEVLRGPREWLQRRKLEPEQAIETPPYDVPAIAKQQQVTDDSDWRGGSLAANSETEASSDDEEQDEQFRSKQPTTLFPHRPADLPPYKAARQQAAGEGSGELWDDWDNQQVGFDGWEDAPPALDDPKYDDSHQVLFKPKSYTFEALDEPDILGEPVDEPAAHASGPLQRASTSNQPGFPARVPGNDQGTTREPALFPGNDFEENGTGGRAASSRTLRTTASKFDVRALASDAGNWLLTTTRSLLPDQVGTGVLGRATGSRTLPLRLVVAGALLLAGILLVFSVMSIATNNQKAATRNILQEAQQLETLANQPGMAADRLQKLQLALTKAQEASTANPQSGDAQLLVTKIQNEIDQAQGITRFGSLKSLFDLAKPAVSGGTAAATPQSTVSGTVALPVNDIIVQSNDAFILDRAAGKLYRCQIAAATCGAVLGAGDTAGGQIVGKLVGMATRVGNLVALDDKLVSYVLSPDTGAWQSQTLGGADSLLPPKDIATYDGNLYLLEAKPGQISKYPSGQYAQAPLTWIQDQGTIDAMKAPVAMAIDGEIYVALTDGNILTMQAGKLDKTITPKVIPGQGAPTHIFTNTDVKDLYLFRAGDGTITRISKDGNTIATYKAPAGAGLDKLSGMTVDEAKGKFYLVQGSKVFEATLTAPSTSTVQPSTGNTPARPTAVP